MKIHVVRLLPHEDLRDALAVAFRDRRIAAGFVLSAVGSLSRASLRYAGARDSTPITGPLEILSLSGTLGPDGCHLHMAVSDARGTVLGGHVLKGNTVRTTAEIVFGEAPDVILNRQYDPVTGYRELVINAIDGIHKMK